MAEENSGEGEPVRSKSEQETYERDQAPYAIRALVENLPARERDSGREFSERVKLIGRVSGYQGKDIYSAPLLTLRDKSRDWDKPEDVIAHFAYVDYVATGAPPSMDSGGPPQFKAVEEIYTLYSFGGEESLLDKTKLVSVPIAIGEKDKAPNYQEDSGQLSAQVNLHDRRMSSDWDPNKTDRITKEIKMAMEKSTGESTGDDEAGGTRPAEAAGIALKTGGGSAEIHQVVRYPSAKPLKH